LGLFPAAAATVDQGASAADPDEEEEDDDDPAVRAVQYLTRALRPLAGGETAAPKSLRAKKLARLPLAHPLADKPLRTVKFGAGGPHELLGLMHIDGVTQSGERSCIDWYRHDILPDIPETTANKRNHGESKFLCVLLDLMLRDPDIVASTKSGSSCLLDVVGRRSLLLHGMLAGTLDWSEGERLLPAAALKSGLLDATLAKKVAKLVKVDSKGKPKDA
jgi:hypothetical protein